MPVMRVLVGLAVLLVAFPAFGAETWPLQEDLKEGACFRLRLQLNLTGGMKFLQKDRTAVVKLTATAGHEFFERVLAVGKTGLAEKTARFYQKAQANIEVGGDKSERTLRDRCRLIVAQRHKDQPLVYCPLAALRRSELELTSEHFDTLCLPGLLPGKAVAVGEQWKLTNPVVQALCTFEGLTEHTLTGKLEEVKDGKARVSITGDATGIDLGAQVKLTVVASATFDLAKKCLTALEWKQKDEREQGPASPATSLDAVTTLSREPIEQPKELADVALVSVPQGFEPHGALLMLDYTDPRGRFEFLHGREWHITTQTEDGVVLRLMERGDFVAQATVTPWVSAGKGQHMSPAEFRRHVEKTPGWQPEKELQAGEVKTDGGRWIYRLAYQGKLDGIEVVQNFYVVANQEGRQVLVTFTMTPKYVERLGTRDLTLAGSVEFPSNK